MNKREEFEGRLRDFVSRPDDEILGPEEKPTEFIHPKNTIPMSEIVRDNFAKFDFYRNGNAFYRITVRGVDYNFPVRLNDLDGASLFATEKAMTLIRYIKKAFQDETFVRAA